MKRDVIYFLAIIVLAFLLYRSCNIAPITRVDQKAVDSLNNAIAVNDIKYTHDSAAWEMKAREQDSIISLLTQSKALQLEAAKEQIVQLTFQRNKYRTAAEAKDTVGQLQSCAEFMKLADSFYTKAVMYEVTIDSLLAAHNSQHAEDTTTIRMLMASRNEARGEVVALQHFLTDSIRENLELRKSLTRSKRGRWILAIIGFAGGAFLGHNIK